MRAIIINTMSTAFNHSGEAQSLGYKTCTDLNSLMTSQNPGGAGSLQETGDALKFSP